MVNLKNLSYYDRLLLKVLISSESEIHGFTLYNRFGVPPDEIAMAIKRLQNWNFVESDGLRVKLTKTGIEWVQQVKFELYSPVNKTWRICPQDFKQDQLKVNKPYSPKISLLDKTFKIKKYTNA
jgi:hypothetical protein